MLPPAWSSTTFSRPVVQSPFSAQFLSLPPSFVAEICLGRTQVVPVGRRLHADAFDGDELALDSKQLLDDALRLLVAPFTEVLVADRAVGVEEVERRPVLV